MSKLGTLILILILGTVLITEVVVPVVTDNPAVKEYFNGPSDFTYVYENPVEDHTFSYNAGDKFYTVDGVQCKTTTNTTPLFSNNYVSFTWSLGNSTQSCTMLDSTGTKQTISFAPRTDSWTATLTDGVFSISKSGTTYNSKAATWCLYFAESSGTFTYNLIDASHPRYIRSVNDFIWTASSSGIVYGMHDNEGFFNGSTVASQVITSETDDGLLLITSANIRNGSNTVARGYVPQSITVIDENFSSLNTMLGIIPLLLILGMIVIAGTYVLRRTN